MNEKNEQFGEWVPYEGEKQNKWIVQSENTTLFSGVQKEQKLESWCSYLFRYFCSVAVSSKCKRLQLS